MRRHLRWTAVLLVLVCPWLTARAAEPAATPKPRELAVLDVRAVGSVDPLVVAGLSAYVAAEATKHGERVIAQADVLTMIGFERQKELLGCTDASCLAEIGGALGVDHLLASEVSLFGGEWLLAMALLDTREAKALWRVSRRAPDQKALLALVPGAVAEVLAPLERSPHRTLGVVLAGTGIALALGGAGAHYASIESWERAKQLGLEGRDYTAFTGARSLSDDQMLAARLLYVTGAVALATGLYFTFSSNGATPPTTVSAAPLEHGGAMMVAGGSF